MTKKCIQQVYFSSFTPHPSSFEGVRKWGDRGKEATGDVVKAVEGSS